MTSINRLLAAFGLLFACVSHAAEKSPNVILIMADDLGYAETSPYGQRKILTPNIMKLAEGGMKFTQFYAGSSVCAPTRSTLMQGLHTGHSDVRGNKLYGIRNGQWPIREGIVTLPRLMKDAGYVTGMIGKWGLGNPGTTGDPLNHGWDLYYGYTDQVLAHNYYPEYLLKNGKKIPLDNKVTYVEKFDGLGSYSTERNDYSHDFMMEEALSFLEENQDNPFFLYLPFTIPHNNGEQLENMQFEVPRQGIYEDKPWSKEQKDYAAMISYLDVGVGQIVRKVKTLGLLRNTLILFTSDNGPMNYRPTLEFFDGNGVLRGAKSDSYEGGIRVPMIAYWPSVVRAGRVTDHIAASWDVLPTLCELAGVETPKGIDGLSFLPLLQGKKQAKHAYLYWEFHNRGGSQSARMGDWKAVRVKQRSDPHAPIKLYNLKADPGEHEDIAQKHPDIVARLLEIMNTERTLSEVFPLEFD